MSTSMKKALAKAKKVSHPNSRKSIAITKKTKKITNREKLKLGSAMRQNIIGEKMMWIKENMKQDIIPYTIELADDLMRRYMCRNDEELEQITIKHSIGFRKNRQHASREDIIRMTKKREETEYETCGIEIPDIFNQGICEMLHKWDGELCYLPNFKFTRFGKKDQLKSIRNKTKSNTNTKTNRRQQDTLKEDLRDKSNVNDKIDAELDSTCSMDLE